MSIYFASPEFLASLSCNPQNLVVRDRSSSDIYMDLYSKFLEKRVVFCYGPVVPPMAELVVPQLWWLNQQDCSRPIELWINGPGGSVVEGLAIIDAMNLTQAEVVTVVQGSAASMTIPPSIQHIW